MPSPEKFNETLDEYGVPEDIAAEICKGFERISSKTKKEIKAKYFSHALSVMEEKLGLEKTREIFEANGCCKSGARLKASMQFARINNGLNIKQKLLKIGNAAYMNMGIPYIDENGNIVVRAVAYKLGDKFACACPTISRQEIQPNSKNYCYCCAGHFKFHYEIMLGCKLSVIDIVSSPLDSEGENPCVIKFSINNDREK